MILKLLITAMCTTGNQVAHPAAATLADDLWFSALLILSIQG